MENEEGGVIPLCIDLYCGLGGWAEGFLAEGYRVVGFDIEAHDYGVGGDPGSTQIPGGPLRRGPLPRLRPRASRIGRMRGADGIGKNLQM